MNRDDRYWLLELMSRTPVLAPDPIGNWWAMAAEMPRHAVFETPHGDISALVQPGLVKDGYATVEPVPNDERKSVPGGDDLDRITHRYTITPAGRAHLSSLTERTKE